MTHLELDLHLFIAGERCGANGRDAAPVIDPSRGVTVGRLPLASAKDLEKAIDAATQAFAVWRKTSAVERGAILRKGAQLMRERQEHAARVMTLEQGKPLAEARMELAVTADILEWAATEGLRTYGRIIPSRSPDSRQMVVKEPIGVAAAFSPWNFPAATPMRKIAGSLAAGCTCILKPSEETPATALAMAQALHDAGLPVGALNIVFGVPKQVSERLIRDAAIRKVSFTGSTAVGKQILALAAEGVKRATMELGGHAPFLVFNDVDTEAVAKLAAASKYRNAGQICTAPNRFLVQQDVHDAFVDAFCAFANQLRVGPGDDSATTMGPVIAERRLEAMERFVQDAKDTGGVVAAGGARIGNQGYFFQPTVLTHLSPDALCLREESFGPLAAIVPFKTEEEAIAIANSLPFGLASYAYTSDANRAVRLADGIEAGMVGVNSLFITLPETPFGGFKESGYGQEGGVEGLEGYLQTKFVAQGRSLLPRSPQSGTPQ